MAWHQVVFILVVSLAMVSSSALRDMAKTHRRASFSKEGSARADPDSVDWRAKGVVTPVRNQGETGAAAVFAVLDSIESLYAIQHGDKLEIASLQELLDCCGSAEHMPGALFECIKNLGGLCREADYKPEEGKCRNATCEPIFKVNGVVPVLQGSEIALEAAVAHQPVMVAVDAGVHSFMEYSSGVYSDPACSARTLDHSMLAVGYGQTEQGQKYWILKNSWGKDWGEEGYMRMAKDHGNMCGVASEAIFPK